MMNNLFSSFDPSVSMNNSWLNWLSILIIIPLMPNNFWVIPSKLMMMVYTFLKLMNKETKTLMKKKENMNSILYNSLFMFILINNFMGLFPYIFTGTSHMVMNMSLALIFWTSIILFSVIKKSNDLFAHLVPNGTPMALMSFMVIIETISLIIRPISLSVRLSANMIAGHLLLTLISSSSMNLNNSLMFTVITAQMTLMILEMAVSMIQAYVFSILTILYASEIQYEKN